MGTAITGIVSLDVWRVGHEGQQGFGVTMTRGLVIKERTLLMMLLGWWGTIPKGI